MSTIGFGVSWVIRRVRQDGSVGYTATYRDPTGRGRSAGTQSGVVCQRLVPLARGHCGRSRTVPNPRGSFEWPPRWHHKSVSAGTETVPLPHAGSEGNEEVERLLLTDLADDDTG